MTYHPFGVRTPAARMENLTGTENPHSLKNPSRSFSLLCPLFIFCDVLMENLLNHSHKTHNCQLVLYFTTQHLVDFFPNSPVFEEAEHYSVKDKVLQQFMLASSMLS